MSTENQPVYLSTTTGRPRKKRLSYLLGHRFFHYTMILLKEGNEILSLFEFRPKSDHRGWVGEGSLPPNPSRPPPQPRVTRGTQNPRDLHKSRRMCPFESSRNRRDVLTVPSTEDFQESAGSFRHGIVFLGIEHSGRNNIGYPDQ